MRCIYWRITGLLCIVPRHPAGACAGMDLPLPFVKFAGGRVLLYEERTCCVISLTGYCQKIYLH